MKIILQLFLSAALWNCVISGEYFDRHCVHLKNWDLHIPDNNTIAVGEKKDYFDSWYTHVNWLETPAGDLTLSYKMEFWRDDVWQFVSEKTLEIFSEGEKEWFDLAKFVRKALGLNPLGKIPGKLRVPSTLFGDDKCWTINFRRSYYNRYRYRIFMDVVDDDGNKVLTGQIRIPQN